MAMMPERLQKLLARAGAGSRRACEEIITAGRVTVDGKVVSELGAKADLATQDVRLDGSRIRPEPAEYWILNKPKGVVCTNFDPAGRRRPIDLMHGTRARLFPVGRLDADSKGLLLMTNDGEFANRLTHPRYGVPKTYLAAVGGDVTGGDVHHLLRGVHLAEGRARAAVVQVVKRGRNRSIVRITLREGRNRQIRRVLARLQHPVLDLVRTRIGRIGLTGLGAGMSRRLMPEEIEYLRTLPDTAPPAPAPRPEGVRPAGRVEGERRGQRPEGPRPPRPAREARPSRQDRPERWEEGGVPQADAEVEAPHPFEKHRREAPPTGRPPRLEGKGERPPRFGHGREGRPPKFEGKGERPARFGRGREGRPAKSGSKGEGPGRFDPRREHRKPRRGDKGPFTPPGRGEGPPAAAGTGRPEKRSRRPYDTDGTGKAGEGHGGHGGRREGRRPGGRGGPPRRGHGPGGHPRQ
jgi:23S rRNA pseudouridine2605 synthase